MLCPADFDRLGDQRNEPPQITQTWCVLLRPWLALWQASEQKRPTARRERGT